MGETTIAEDKLLSQYVFGYLQGICAMGRYKVMVDLEKIKG